MARNRDRRYKKTQDEAQAYRNVVRNSSYIPEGTVPIHNEMLRGSGEIVSEEPELNKKEKVKAKPWYYTIWDFVKRKIVPELFVALLIPVISWGLNITKTQGIIEFKIDYLQKEIEQINNDYINKELLDLKLKEIINEVNTANVLQLHDIDLKLVSLEKEIEALNSIND